MITTRNTAWDARFRLLRQHAMSVPDTVRHGSAQVIFESYPEVGFNYRMTDIQAAVGREQLKRLPSIVASRRSLAQRYRELLADIPGLGLPFEPAWARSNWQSFAVSLPQGAPQRAVMQFMLDAGVSTRRGIMSSHREQPYLPQASCAELRASERAQDTVVLLPLFPGMSDDEQHRVAAALRSACGACGAGGAAAALQSPAVAVQVA